MTQAPTRPTTASIHGHPNQSASDEAADCQNRGHGIGEDVQIGCPEIVIPVVMVTVMIVSMFVMVAVLVAEQPGADEIDHKPDHGDGYRFCVGDGDRPRQSHQTLIGDHECDDAENDRARESGEVAELSRAEGEARVMGVSPRILISECGDGERRGVRRHVPAVGEKRHRAEHDAADDLGDHHRGCQPDDEPGSPLIAGVPRAQKNVLVCPRIESAGVHGAPFSYPGGLASGGASQQWWARLGSNQ